MNPLLMVVIDAVMMAIWRCGRPEAPLAGSEQGSHSTSEQP